MVLIQREIPSQVAYVNSQDLNLAPEKILGRLSNDSMAGLQEQLCALLSYASSIFNDLLAEASKSATRIRNLGERVEHTFSNLQQIENFYASHSAADFLDNPKTEWHARKGERHQHFTRASRSESLNQLCNAARPPPNLSTLDAYNENGESCLKKYTNPDFFIEEWIILQKKEHEKAKERKAKRREERAKSKKSVKRAAQKKEVKKLVRTRYVVNQFGERVAVTESVEGESDTVGASATPAEEEGSSTSLSSLMGRESVSTDSGFFGAAPPASPAPAPPSPVVRTPQAPTMQPRPPSAMVAPSMPVPRPPSAMASPAPPAPTVPAVPPPPPAPKGPAPPPLPVAPAAPAPPAAPAAPAAPPAPPTPAAPSGLLAQIRTGIQLKQAKPVEKPKTIDEGPFNVAAILARRIAIEGSDDESEEDDDSDNDWDE